jgi:RimJ/RimL family protein N-acetyltransferase
VRWRAASAHRLDDAPSLAQDLVMPSSVGHIEIAPIRLHHAEGLRRAFDLIAREARYLSDLKAPPIDEVRDYILKTLERNSPMFVALGDAAVVGWCDIRRDPTAARAHRGTLGIGVAPRWRDCGIGSKLLLATLERARSAGFVRIELDVFSDNFRALALYEKFGFVREGYQRDAARIDGRYRDSVLMALIDRANGEP